MGDNSTLQQSQNLKHFPVDNKPTLKEKHMYTEILENIDTIKDVIKLIRLLILLRDFVTKLKKILTF
jgi:hypothetical protein